MTNALLTKREPARTMGSALPTHSPRHPSPLLDCAHLPQSCALLCSSLSTTLSRCACALKLALTVA
eukprot:2649834-Pleurochrysis_carterae.AAC.1